LGLAAWALIAADYFVFIGIALIHLYAVLDSVDGEIARATGKTSLKGMYLEDHSAYLMINGYWLAMGAYLAGALETSWPFFITVVYVAFGRSAMPAARRALLKAIGGGKCPDLEVSGRTAGARAALSGLTRFVFVDLLHPSTVWAVSTTVLLIERLTLTGHPILLVTTAGYLMLSAVREVGTVFRLLGSSSLNRQLVDVATSASDIVKQSNATA
jgi:phosphatidylglycerophosphate synthase